MGRGDAYREYVGELEGEESSTDWRGMPHRIVETTRETTGTQEEEEVLFDRATQQTKRPRNQTTQSSGVEEENQGRKRTGQMDKKQKTSGSYRE